MSSNAREASRVIARFAAAAQRGTVAAIVAEMPKLAAATQGRMPRDSGDLIDSVAVVSPVVNGPVIAAGVEVGSDHGAAQEFGTGTVRAHPSFRPSIRESQERTPGAIAREIRHHFTKG